MKNKFTLILAPTAIFCWCFFLLQGCKKDPIIEDTTLLTQDDNLSLAKDTLHTKMFSEFEVPLVSSNTTRGILGTLTDPDFGTTYAGFYAQYLLTGTNITFGDSRVLDSVVLTLKYNDSGTYGKFTQGQTVKVFAMNESLLDSVSYYTNSTFQIDNTPIGTRNGYIPDLVKDTLTVQGITFPPHLRIRLSDSFGKNILDADTNSTLIDNTNFLSRFKGLYVSTSSSTTGDGITYLDLSSGYSAVTLYYHNSLNTPLFYTMPLSGVRVNHIQNYYTAAINAATVPDETGKEKMYLQAGAGVNGKIFITDLDKLPKNIAINKAEIILTQATGNTYTAPSFLSLFRIDDAGQAQLLDDGSFAGLLSQIETETINGITVNRYHFDFKIYFQKLIQGYYRNNGFYVKPVAANSSSERVIIANSSTDENYKITLIVTYTKL